MSITRHHNDWLSLVPASGPFLSLPVLTQAFPQGLEAHDADHARRLRSAFEEWNLNQSGRSATPAIHRAWIDFVLKETLGFEPHLAEGQSIPPTLKSDVPEYGETLRPDWIVNDPETGKPALLVQFYPRSQSLDRPVASLRWKTSPDTRMMQLLHDTGIRLGLVSNGDQWMLVNAPKNESTGFASWYGHLWMEEPVSLRAFRTLLSSHRFFGVPDEETLVGLLDRSASDQQEVTDQLGYQVRKAVEVLVQALDKADQDHARSLLADVDEKVLYEAALTVMMRLVFLFCAEERDLLLLGDELYDRNYAVSTLREQLRAAADQHGEEILGLRHDAWTRLLTTFRAIYAGVKHDRMKLPAYGGSLFDPDRFPFLEGRAGDTSWKDTLATPLPVSNRTALHLLEALQILQVKIPGGGAPEARKLSFRELDIEQIGHVYEGLLDHTARRAAEPYLGLQGTRDKEPEITLAQLETVAANGEKELLTFLREQTGRSESALKKGLAAKIDDQLRSRFRTVCQDPVLWARIEPFAGLVRQDTSDYPIVIRAGSVFVTTGADRRSSGTHYTPKSLTEPVVQRTLEPLVYNGPAEGLPREEWKLRTPREILALRCCDLACGSGAFLVQLCRYLAVRLLEAWDYAQQANPRSIGLTPEGETSVGASDERLIPADPDERQTFALRLVAHQCVYGVDKNPLAVEMAKLSLWLLTLAKDKPFEFLNHAIKTGDSLVGIRSLDQLRTFSLDGKSDPNPLFLHVLDSKVTEAIALRRRIATIQASTVRDVEEQERILREANEAVEMLKGAADLLVAVEFYQGSAADRKAVRAEADQLVVKCLGGGDSEVLRKRAGELLGGTVPLHWVLEFPEVLVERGGFDGFVGNPPFMGGSKISNRIGERYLAYLLESFPNSHGKADLCSYFVRCPINMLREYGCAGFIATNTITQGATRTTSLASIVEAGGQIYWANPSMRWPGTASVEVALIAYSRRPESASESLSDTLTLDAQEDAFRLDSNKGMAFIGTVVIGKGFEVSSEERSAYLQRSQINEKVIQPYINGSELNSFPDLLPRRWIINFFDWPLDRQSAPNGYAGPVAADFPHCLEHVRMRVKPQRDEMDRAAYRLRWWQFAEKQLALYSLIRDNSHVTVLAQVGKHLAVARLPHPMVYDQKLIVFTDGSWEWFSVIQSAVHHVWARRPGSLSLRTDPTYTVEFCCETFPAPSLLPPVLAEVGAQLYRYRSQLMVAHGVGLTKAYNRFHHVDELTDDFLRLRQLHVELDAAVVSAYGWSDLDLSYGFHETKQGVRFTISETARREVLARLLRLNHERYEEEVRQGLHDKKSKGGKQGKGRKGSKKHEPAGEAPSLFE